MLETLNPGLSSGKQFERRINNITESETLEQALVKWKFSRKQEAVIYRRIHQLRPRKKHQAKPVHYTQRTDLH